MNINNLFYKYVTCVNNPMDNGMFCDHSIFFSAYQIMIKLRNVMNYRGNFKLFNPSLFMGKKRIILKLNKMFVFCKNLILFVKN